MRSKSIIRNIIVTLLLQLLTIICGFIVPKLIISTYSSQVNGLITSITEFLAYITLIESGFGQVIKSCLYKPIADNDENKINQILKASEKIFRKISYIFIFYMIVLCIILPFLFNNRFDNTYTLSLIIIISISTLFEYYFGMTYKLYLEAKQKVYIVSMIQIGTLILNTLMVIILVKLNVSIQVVKLVSSLIFILRPILQYKYVRKVYNIKLNNIRSDYIIKQKYDGLIQHIAYVIHSKTDIIILTLVCDIKEVSVYAIYYLIVTSIKNIICNSFIKGIDSTFGDMIAKEEKEKLYNTFNMYEGIYLTISTIMFICTIILIIPFVKVYTADIFDVNYVRPTFAYIIVLAEFIYVIRQLYYSLVKVAGHFKETKKGAIIETIINLVISTILVFKYGIIGVAVGTLLSVIVRTIDIVIYTSKKILNRSLKLFIKRFILIIVEFILVIFMISILVNIDIIDYISWIIYATIIFMITSIIVVTINSIIYKENIFNIIRKHKEIIRR